MSQKVDIKFNPAGFAECLAGMSGIVRAETEKIADRATSYLTKGSGFHVEVSNEARFRDPSYGVSRPVGRVIANDEESSREEAENKILSKAVNG